MPSPDSLSRKRLFIALWPSVDAQTALFRLAEGVAGGKPVVAANTHLTLAFLGASSVRQEACYRSVLSSLSFSSFMLQVDTLGFWQEPRVLWAGMTQVPPELLRLFETLNGKLRSCGFSPESRPFYPHITLKRKFSGPMPPWGARSPIQWTIKTIALVQSVSTPEGVHYQPLLKVHNPG